MEWRVEVGDKLIPFLASVFGYSDADNEFLLEEFDPQLQMALESAPDVEGSNKRTILKHGLGFVLKMVPPLLPPRTSFACDL